MADMRDSLARTITHIRSETHQVSASASAAEIATGSSDLNRRSMDQAAAIEECASTMEEMASTSDLWQPPGEAECDGRDVVFMPEN